MFITIPESGAVAVGQRRRRRAGGRTSPLFLHFFVFSYLFLTLFLFLNSKFRNRTVKALDLQKPQDRRQINSSYLFRRPLGEDGSVDSDLRGFVADCCWVIGLRTIALYDRFGYGSIELSGAGLCRVLVRNHHCACAIVCFVVVSVSFEAVAVVCEWPWWQWCNIGSVMLRVWNCVCVNFYKFCSLCVAG